MTMTDVSTSALRQEVTERILGLNALANFVDAHPDLPTPLLGYPDLAYTIFVYDAEALARVARTLMKGAPVGDVTKEFSDTSMKVARSFGGGVSLEVMAPRSNVCERVVVGTETVEVPDPDAPKVTVEREVVEWRCSPLLDESRVA